jgi:putative spermidine/putrescine transport system permease protein
MRLSTPARVVLAIVTGVILFAVYLPLFVVLVNSFSTSTSLTWPPPGFTLEWWGKAFQSAGALDAVLTSVQVAIIATAIALIPIVIIFGYLFLVRRTGALDNL